MFDKNKIEERLKIVRTMLNTLRKEKHKLILEMNKLEREEDLLQNIIDYLDVGR